MFLRPQNVLSAFGVEPGWHVADLGSGAGHYTFILSDLVTPSGRVYAVDVAPELLHRISDIARAEKRSNIHIVHSDLEEIGSMYLRDELLDSALAANIFFQVEEKGKFLTEMRRSLKPRGRVLLIDWTDSFNHLGPHPESVVPPEKATRMFENNGFNLIRELPAGDHHYALVFQKI